VAESAGDRRNDAADRARASTSQRLTQQFLAAHPDDYYAHGYLGYIYLQMGDLAHAREEYSRSYELWPSEDTQKHLEAVRKRKQSEASKQN
jgi:Flp pilus assembly protein TadD